MAGAAAPSRLGWALGHSGWAPGQLDREMQDNAWLVVDADAALVFDADFDAKWQRALASAGRQGRPGRQVRPRVVLAPGGTCLTIKRIGSARYD